MFKGEDYKLILLRLLSGPGLSRVISKRLNYIAITRYLILSFLLFNTGSSWLIAGDLKGRVHVKADAIMVGIQDIRATFTIPESHAVIHQKSMRFDPILLPVMVGTTVDFPNEEQVLYHNVFSISAPKSFELGTYRAGENRSVIFDKTGVVEVFCTIHVRMYAVIPVWDNPYFSTCNENGEFTIKNIPPGNHTVKVILVYLKKQEYKELYKNVFIPQEGVVTLDFHKEKL